MRDNEENIYAITEPELGEIKVINIKRNNVDTVELQMWDGSKWIDFDDLLNEESE